MSTWSRPPAAVGTSSDASREDTRRLYTFDELLAEFPESNLQMELWDGEIIMAPAPSFWHQKVALFFYRRLHEWVASRGLGEVIASPIDMILSPHRAVQPDVLYVSKERLEIIHDRIRGAADLVAEVVSLGGRHWDRIEKKDLYEQHGVKEFWIIDPEPGTVDVLILREGQYFLHIRAGAGQIARSALLEGFEIEIDRLFQP